MRNGITFKLLQASSAPRKWLIESQFRQFSSTPAARAPAANSSSKNRIYNPVRIPDDFRSYLLLSTSSRRPLITLWTASYCATCRQVEPVLHNLISNEGVGEAEGGVTYCEIEYDAPDIMSSGLGMEYMITAMPTLLAFDGGEAMTATKVTDARKLKDTEFLKEWIRTEAQRRGTRGGGGGGGGSILKGTMSLGGLFGSGK